MVKKELKKIKSIILNKNHEKEKIENEKIKVQEEINTLNEKHLKFLDYNRYKTNAHRAVAAATFIGMNYISVKFLNQPVTNSLLISALPTLITTEATRSFFTMKRNKIKKENPQIDFENYNKEEIYEKLMELHNKKMTLSDELTIINEDCKKCGICCEKLLTEEIPVEIENKEENVKVKVMTLTRKK